MGKNSRILSWEGHNQLCFMEIRLVIRWRPGAAGLRMGRLPWSGPLGRGWGEGAGDRMERHFRKITNGGCGYSHGAGTEGATGEHSEKCFRDTDHSGSV